VPDRLLVDEPAGIVVSGCTPGQEVTVTASSQLVDGTLGDLPGRMHQLNELVSIPA
jgi:hypothetical protein